MIDLSDPKIFKAQYDSHFSGLLYYAVGYVKREDIACDIVQDLFIRLWEKGESFKNDQVFLTYIYRSVRNRCLTYLRDSRRQSDKLSSLTLPESEDTLLQEIIEAEIYALVNDVFAQLPESSRRVYLKSLEGKSHKEIAEELKIAVNTIKRHKNNANKYLRSRLRKIFLLISLVG